MLNLQQNIDNINLLFNCVKVFSSSLASYILNINLAYVLHMLNLQQNIYNINLVWPVCVNSFLSGCIW